MKRLEPTFWTAAVVLLVFAVGASFYAPGLAKTGGIWPIPLDDVYIHFGFARSAALGHPFQWIPGNGYSSGGTSLTYPLVLAPGYGLGLRGDRLGAFAAVVAWASIVDLCRSLRGLALRRRSGPRWVVWAIPALVLSVPLLDWHLFSGMETALFVALVGRALRATDDAFAASPSARCRAQLRCGLWGALLCATRPEAAPLAGLLGLSAAYGCASLSLPRSIARAVGPPVAYVIGIAGVNRLLTGEASAAGAVRKLVTSNPYLTPLEAAGEVVKNLAALRAQAFESALGGPRLSWTVVLLAGVALADRRFRRLALPLLGGAYGALLLVALNSTARFQNLRYAMPTLAMLLAAAALGLVALARRRPRALTRPLAFAAALVATIAPSPWFPKQIDHFARASANIAGQQVEVARRLSARPSRPRRVLVGDAGAIPFVSGLDALDGLGLGGFRGMPFARASVHGVPSVVELIERLPAAERPDVLALYPSWWVGLADVFGRRMDAVRIDDNVICGADEKVIYDADWSTLASPGEAREGAVDELDTADVVSERAHGYEVPAPGGGWEVGATLALADGRLRYDGGRIVPEGRRERWVVGKDVMLLRAALVLRTGGGGPVHLAVTLTSSQRADVTRDVTLPERPHDRWLETTVPLGAVSSGDRVTIEVVAGAYRSFHMWMERQ